MILFVLAREYLKAQGKEDEAKALKLEDFAGKIEALDLDKQAKSFEEVSVAEKVSEGV